MLCDKKIQETIRHWKQECGITHTVLFRYSGNVLKICTDKPGIMIGFRGSTVYKYTEIFKSYDSDFEKVEFVETDGIA